MRSDRELIALYRAGDQAAFGEFYERHRKPLYVYILSMVRSRETAEELLQETFYSLLKHLDRLNGSENGDLRPFLLRTARNRTIDVLRRARRGEEVYRARAQDLLFKMRTAEANGAGVGDPEEMSALLRGLPGEQREAVFLKVFLGMTFREIAGLTGSPEPSVVSRYRYGLEKIRAALTRGVVNG